MAGKLLMVPSDPRIENERVHPLSGLVTKDSRKVPGLRRSDLKQMDAPVLFDASDPIVHREPARAVEAQPANGEPQDGMDEHVLYLSFGVAVSAHELDRRGTEPPGSGDGGGEAEAPERSEPAGPGR